YPEHPPPFPTRRSSDLGCRAPAPPRTSRPPPPGGPPRGGPRPPADPGGSPRWEPTAPSWGPRLPRVFGTGWVRSRWKRPLDPRVAVEGVVLPGYHLAHGHGPVVSSLAPGSQ